MKENLHPAFYELAKICAKINFGVIKELRIQNGLPVFEVHEEETELEAKVEVTNKLV